MQPHLVQLRAERGLSQLALADLLGTTKLTVSRWERGVMSPRRYFVERLCRVFECEESALGFACEAETLESQALGGVLYDPAIPLLEAFPLVGRDCALSRLKDRLCMAEEQVSLVAIYGLPGVGKTSLVTTLAHSPQMRECFSDGVLWATLGPTPNLSEHLHRWSVLLGLHDAAFSALSIEAQCQALHAAIGMRSILLVLDDVWDLSPVQALIEVGGPNCASLLTTRSPAIALDVDACPLRLSELNEEQSLLVLSDLAPSVVEREERAVRSLVAAVDGLPLALVLFGNYLRKESYQVPARRTIAALERLSSAYERLELSETSLLASVHPSHSKNGTISLQSSIEASDRYLSPLARECLYALSVVSSDSVGFSEDVALAAAACSVTELDELLDAGLLQYQEFGQYRLHPVISDYARLRLDDQTEQMVRERLLIHHHQSMADEPEDGVAAEEVVAQVEEIVAQASEREYSAMEMESGSIEEDSSLQIGVTEPFLLSRYPPGLTSYLEMRGVRRSACQNHLPSTLSEQLASMVRHSPKTKLLQEQVGGSFAETPVQYHILSSAVASFVRVWSVHGKHPVQVLRSEVFSGGRWTKPPPGHKGSASHYWREVLHLPSPVPLLVSSIQWSLNKGNAMSHYDGILQ